MPKQAKPLPHTASLVALANGAASDLAVGLTPSRQEKMARLLRRIRFDGTTDRLAPYLEAGEALLDAFVGEVAKTAGECGPIAGSVAHTAATQKATSVAFFDHAAAEPDPEKAMRFYRFAADLGDRSRANMLAALEVSVRIARSKPVTPGDPLAAFDVKPEPDDEPSG